MTLHGVTIKEFKLVERLGKGGWGEVWAAEQQIVKTRVAIKLLRSEVSGDEAHVQRFFNEAIAVGRIPHAGIVKIFDVGFERGQAFLIMELLAGEVLSARIRRETRLPFEQVIAISRQIASVLAATHAAGIVHRDLKPDNVFLVPDAELGERVKILDFGIAKLSTVGSTGGASLGTPAYMAPEQWHDAASIDERADLYSLGCLMFELCCGRPPFLATTPAEACTKHLHETPVRARSLAPALPIELDELIDYLLSKQPSERPTLAAIEAVLARAVGDEPRPHRPLPRASGPIEGGASRSSNRPVEGTAETLTQDSGGNAATVTSLAGAVIVRSQPPAPKKRWLLAAGGLLAAGAIAATVVLATREPDEPTPLAGSGGVLAAPLELPAVGLGAIADYRFPTPATIGNQRSEQVWTGARDSFATACTQPGAPATWCAGEKFAIGELALIRDDIPGAIQAFREATTIDPKWSTGFLGLSNALSYQRKAEEALDAARKAQQLEPAAWQPAMASARAYISVQRVDDALIEYRRAMNLSPPNNAVMLSEVALAFHYARKDAEAEKLAAKATAIDPALVAVHVLKAELALEVNDGVKALESAELALAISPKNGAALIARGDALALLGRASEARTTYQRALQLRGGMNILAISEPRLAAISEALETGQLPVPRTETRSASHPNATPAPRSVTATPGPTLPRGIADSAEATRSPSTQDPAPPRSPVGRTSTRQEPVPTDERSPPQGGGDSTSPVAEERTPPSENNNNNTRSPPNTGDETGADRSPPTTQPTERTPPRPDSETRPRSPPSPPKPRSPPNNKRPSRSPPAPDPQPAF